MKEGRLIHGLGLEEAVVRHVFADGSHHAVRRVEHSNGVGEAGVFGAGEDVVGETQLFDPPESLVER